MRINFIVLLTLVSCNNFPVIAPQERCVIVLQEPLEESYCRCHMYSWSSDSIGRISESTNYPINKCDKLIGFSPDSSLEIYTWQESIRLWLKRKNRK